VRDEVDEVGIAAEVLVERDGRFSSGGDVERAVAAHVEPGCQG
jgi:hypothetical protein